MCYMQTQEWYRLSQLSKGYRCTASPQIATLIGVSLKQRNERHQMVNNEED